MCILLRYKRVIKIFIERILHIERLRPSRIFFGTFLHLCFSRPTPDLGVDLGSRLERFWSKSSRFHQIKSLPGLSYTGSSGKQVASQQTSAAATGPDVQLEEDKLPEDFVRCDVTIASTGRRHIVMATDHQLDLLSKARRWYMDATFCTEKSSVLNRQQL